MRAVAAAELPDRDRHGRELVYEPKWDGWRCLAWVEPTEIRLYSRQGRLLTPYFPDVVQHLRASVPPGCVLDGELIVWDPIRARTSFPAIQRRVTAGRRLPEEAAAAPAHYVVFDLLAEAGLPILGEPLQRRRRRLERLLVDAPPQLPLCPQTRDVQHARVWQREWAMAGVEGIVAKPWAGPYRPGKADWIKVKSRESAEAIIGGVTGGLAHPGALLVGRLDTTGRLRYVGMTHRLAAAQRSELARALAGHATVQSDRHPWPVPLPAGWSGQLGDRRQPLPYVQVEPVLVVELQVDAAYDLEHGRWRHPAKFIRLRPDLTPADVPRHRWER